MKKVMLTTVYLMLGFVLMAAPAMAYDGQVTSPAGYGPYNANNGGEFTWKVSQDLEWVLKYYKEDVTKNVSTFESAIQSFCLETGEYINQSTTYNVTISDKAMNGGNGTSGDPISLGTALLYSQFAAGTLQGYNYGDGRLGSADALQKAIWWLEGETGGEKNYFVEYAINYFNELNKDALADAKGAYGVAVMNLYATGGARAQDQLIMVPEPATLILMGIGLLGIALAARRFSKTHRA